MTPQESTEHIDVRYVANLARLELTEEEVEGFQKDLDSILGYIDALKEVDVEGVEPMMHAVPMQNVMREDVRGETIDREAMLANAPATVQNLVRVPNILD